MGAVKPMAVTWAMGMRAMAKNHSITAVPWATPRSRCNPIREGFLPDATMRSSSGAMSTMPKA